ncbi:MAG: serine/threonine protein kinase [Candidatus Hydrogenedentes bacterium]|nr:serine/threonine protein kinase [Candidatus Hydrogenedentota bacterium]
MVGQNSLVGKTVGNYRIVEELGHGGMGVVYKARDIELDRLVALKVLPSHLSQEETFIKRFVREARACAGLNHPNIVTIYRVGTHEGLYYIAMEYVEGETLFSIIHKGGKLGVRTALEIIRQAADALAAAHAQNIVHRDIKPHNIMINSAGRVKIMDFGLARAHLGETKLTASNALLGTPHYMAPEQFMSAAVDARADLYSLGVTLFEMLTGKLPFTGDTPGLLMKQVVTQRPPTLRELDPSVSPRLSLLVTKMMAKTHLLQLVLDLG